MRGYGQACPVAKAAEIFCERWTALIIRDLGTGASRFSELQRGVPLMSRSMLSKRLKELERENIIERLADAGHGVVYRLTPAGREFLPIVQELGRWGERWTRRRLSQGETNSRLLLWEMERSVRADAFGPGRTVVQIDFTDDFSSRRRWWFLHEDGEVHLCVKDPGYEIGLYLAAPLRDLVALWRGELHLGVAMRSGRLTVQGSPACTRALRTWLPLPAGRGESLSR